MRRWETYAALLAVVLASLGAIAESNRLKIVFVALAIAILALIGVARLRKRPTKKIGFDAYDRIERIREERSRRHY